MKAIFTKKINSLVPASSEAEELLKKLKLNTLVTVEIKKSRNLKNHRRYFSLLKLVINNQEQYDNTEELLIAIKLRLKMYDVKVGLTGKPFPLLHSINFSKMGELEFKSFFDKTLNLMRELLGSTTREIENELINYY